MGISLKSGCADKSATHMGFESFSLMPEIPLFKLKELTFLKELVLLSRFHVNLCGIHLNNENESIL